MRTWLLRARESFWLLPTVFGVGAILVAVGLTELDRLLQDTGVRAIPFIADLSATGGRAILVVIGGTMLGVAATSFSITIAVLATMSSTYGPRLVRNFMADRGNQVVLAVLTSTFLYTLVVLRAVRTEQDSTAAFVPAIAVSFAVLLAICDVAVLVYFIDHIAASVQVTTLQARVLGELLGVIDLLYPEEPPRSAPSPGRTAITTTDETFEARSTGYVQFVDIERLVAIAESSDTILRVAAPPGTYVLQGQTVVESLVERVDGEPSRASSSVARADTSRSESISEAISIAAPRTPHQDLRFAAQALVEIGVRGLASGSNDPYTAVAAIDALSGAMVTLCNRRVTDGRHADESGEVRVVCEWPTAAEVIADALLAFRTYGVQHPLVVAAVIRFIIRVETVATGDARRALRDQSEAFRNAYLDTHPAAIDAEVALEALDAVCLRLAPA